ncbi:MAG: tetratricopeptide repeat protein [Planctomycetota bacterium]|nr:MAG: tetratricopeptide repeat protein [Planctomycetota bacterium]REJ95827.1 MAG: tetratricopeptide repeat protein [Planctomycetota bacterium]REK29504.1 MAG: tetratricopeptide repeat protein [Planctomycetota bacterium]REK46589.1 MAG: tetratricopeptide repeat protein [Planctomycetota bacterium]
MWNEEPRTALLTQFYEQYLGEQDAGRFIRQVADRYASATLERLVASNHRETRRAAVLALGFVGAYESNHILGRALVDKDRGVRSLAENSIRAVWRRAGNESHRRDLQSIADLVELRRYAEAIERATRLVEQAPWYAEAWSQRAIAFYHVERFTESIRDCRQALEINPYHFGAAAGMGQCHLRLHDRNTALDCFRRALRLNPGLENVRAQVIYLQKLLKEE